MAASGLFGMLGYNMIRLAEDIPCSNDDPLNLPHGLLIRPQLLAIFDNVKNQICLVAPIYADEATAQGFIDNAILALQAPIDPQLLQNLSAPHNNEVTPQSNIAEADYKASVAKAIDYIHAGDIFQAVLSQRFSCPFAAPPFALYRALRQLNPSPFMFHLQMDGFALIGSSPEIMVRVRENTVTIRPIAGTRKRGTDKVEDDALAAELLADEKERAEHLMLLDLGRNDVGKVSEYGTVNVTDQFMIERYSHVMHIVSNVEGQLAQDKDSLDAFLSGFPAGTVSGAPKIRAMEIIDDLEQLDRSFYAGAVGYFAGNGDIDSCITLRTGLVKDGRLYVQAGGGVVADSDPDFEHQECINKAKAVFAAAEQALSANTSTNS